MTEQKRKNKILRQGLNVSINELKELVEDLENQTRQLNLELGLEEKTMQLNTKWLINIINKEPICSDTWEIEK
jgi:hypothetical protein